jgi:iron(III) transport system ATP-binding protein
LHASGTGLNFSADFSINAVRDLGISSGATIEVALPPKRLRVFAQPRSATA